MAKYLVKNSDEFRTASVGRLRWSPGQQMWIGDEVFSDRKVQSFVASGRFQVLQTRGLAAVPPEPEAPEVALEVEEPQPAPPDVLEPEEHAEEEELPALALTRTNLTSMRVAELREVASSLEVPWAGLRKAALVDAILASGEE